LSIVSFPRKKTSKLWFTKVKIELTCGITVHMMKSLTIWSKVKVFGDNSFALGILPLTGELVKDKSYNETPSPEETYTAVGEPWGLSEQQASKVVSGWVGCGMLPSGECTVC
jgi:hypothetical protein